MLRSNLMISFPHKGKPISTSVGSLEYEIIVDRLLAKNNRLGGVRIGYEHRPDLMSNLFFDSPHSWWVICEMNAVTDPFEDLNISDELKLP